MIVLSGDVKSIAIHPIKAARRITLERTDVLASGLRFDRRFMVVDANGKFITQRSHPKMALVDVTLEADHLLVGTGIGKQARVSLEPTGGSPIKVRVWDDEVDAIEADSEGTAFFEDHLGERCTLVFMPPSALRAIDPSYAAPGDRVALADAFPILIASQSSLDALNDRIIERGGEAVPIERFRPNIVIAGVDAWVEETCSSITLGTLIVRTPKRCSRCKVTTVDPEVGSVVGPEPLRTLATFRRGLTAHDVQPPYDANQVYFAMNAIPNLASGEIGSIAVGDRVVLTPRPTRLS